MIQDKQVSNMTFIKSVQPIEGQNLQNNKIDLSQANDSQVSKDQKS